MKSKKCRDVSGKWRYLLALAENIEFICTEKTTKQKEVFIEFFWEGGCITAKSSEVPKKS